MSACEPLGVGHTFPLDRWLQQASAPEPPLTSGYVVLAGNTSAHTSALRCRLRELAAGGSELRHLATDASAWHEISCDEGCPTLLDGVASHLDQRRGLWSVVLLRRAERAPPAQVAALATRFFQQALCTHATGSARMEADCRRVLFVLSTGWGARTVMQPEHRGRPRAKLLSTLLAEAAPWLSNAAMQLTARQRLRSATAVVLGEAPADRFAALIREQDTRRASSSHEGSGDRGGGGGRGTAMGAQTARALPDLGVFERVSGQTAVLDELRARMRGIASGALAHEGSHILLVALLVARVDAEGGPR